MADEGVSHSWRQVWNDTLFLSSLNVMDYSLLLGLVRNPAYSENGAGAAAPPGEPAWLLVAGVIDYCRQYTWWEEAETRVKRQLSDAPTVVPTKEYRRRLREALHRYFM